MLTGWQKGQAPSAPLVAAPQRLWEVDYNGVLIKVLGIYPGSRTSEREAYALVEASRPAALYIDLHPELVKELCSQVEEGQVGSEKTPADGFLPVRRYGGSGWLSSIRLRSMLIDNELSSLLGAELYGPYKAGLCASVGREPPRWDILPRAEVGSRTEMQTSRGEEEEEEGVTSPTPSATASLDQQPPAATANRQREDAGAAASAPPSKPFPNPLDLPQLSILAFPFRADYNNGMQMERPGHLSAVLEGDNGTLSSGITATLGNLWKLVKGECPGLRVTVSLPPLTTAFSRGQLAGARQRVAQELDAIAAPSSEESCDVADWLLQLESSFLEKKMPEVADIYRKSGQQAELQARAVAFELQDQAARLPPGSTVVALVNLGSMGILRRQWEAAAPAHSLCPPFSMLEQVAATGVAAAGLGGALYLTHRYVLKPVIVKPLLQPLRQKFPRAVRWTGRSVAGLAVAALGMMAWGLTHPEMQTYGPSIKGALARPVVAPAVPKLTK